MERNSLNKPRGFLEKLRAVFAAGPGAATLEQIEETLIEADMDLETVAEAMEMIKKSGTRDLASAEAFLKSEFITKLSAVPGHTAPVAGEKPDVIMLVGINGGGKTTTAAKLSALFAKEKKKTMLVAADTFRAAAIEQLEHWAQKTGALFSRGMENADPAAVVFDGLSKAASEKCDVAIVDTAGRLHTQDNLMQELIKVRRTASKAAPKSRIETLMIIDANTGKNAVTQARMFASALQVDAIVLTKIDSTSKGGSILRIRHELNLPVRYVTFGENLSDMEEFDAAKFADNLFS